MDNINEYIHIIGLILLGLILIIVVIYFYNNVLNKHTDIVEKYVARETLEAHIDTTSNYGVSGAGGADSIFNTHTSSEMDTYEIDKNNKIYLRQCAIYFTGEEDESIADGTYWLLIDENVINDNKVKYPEKYIKLDEKKFSILYNLIKGHFANQNEEIKYITNPEIPNNTNTILSHRDNTNQMIIVKNSLKIYNNELRKGNLTYKYLVGFFRDHKDPEYKFLNSKLNNLFDNNPITMYNYLEIDFNGKKYFFLPAQTKNTFIASKCDRNLGEDTENTCGYKFEDDWHEINYTTSKNIDGNIVQTKYPHKIYNQGYTNYNKENSQNMMKTCFKKTNNGKAIKFKYDNSGVLKYDYSGEDTDNSIGMKTNLDDGISGSYINMKFENSEDTKANYGGILSTICSLKYDKINDDNLAENTKYIKFNLDKNNNVKSVEYVAMNSSQTGFNIRTDRPKLIEDAAFGVMIESYNNNIFTGRCSLKLKIFKSIYIPTIHNVEIFRFGYNYLCGGDNANILRFNKKNAHMHLGNMIIPPDPNVQYSKHSLLYNFNDLQIDNGIWNDFINETNQRANKPVDQKIAIIRMLNAQKINKIEAIKKRYNESRGIITNKLQNAGITDIDPYSDDDKDIGIVDNFTNYKEHFEIRDLGKYYTETEQKNLGLNEARRVSAEWKDLENRQKSKQVQELSGTLPSILDIERSPIINPYGHQELTDGHKPFNFKSGFYIKVNLSDRESVYSAKNKYSSIEALNNNTPITIVTDVLLNLNRPGIKVSEMKAWHEAYSNNRWATLRASYGDGLHPRHQRSWSEGGYWPGAYRASDGKWRGGTPHHPGGFYLARRHGRWMWLGRRGVNSWAIMKARMDRGAISNRITVNTHILNRPNNFRNELYTQIYHTYFLAPHTGEYLWAVRSDDAGMLYAKQVFPYDKSAIMKLVVDNHRLHAPQWMSGKIYMEKGRVYELYGTFTERRGQDIFKMYFRVNGYNNNNDNYDIMSKNRGYDGSLQSHYYQYMTSRTEETKRFENIKWSFNQDGTFGATIEALKDKPFNLDKVAFMNTPIGSHINPNIYTTIPISDKELREYYKIEAKGDTKKLYFKASFTERGLIAKYNTVATGASYKESEISSISNDYSSHIHVLDDSKYFNIKEDDIMSSISEKKLVIDPWSFVRFVVCGYIYLDAGKYRFYVNNNIPSKNIYKDNKFILQGRDNTILERITENKKDIKVKVSGFYKYSHNCYVLNEAIDPLDYEKSLSDLKYDIKAIRNAGYSKQIVIDKLNSMFNYSSSTMINGDYNKNDFVNTVIEHALELKMLYDDIDLTDEKLEEKIAKKRNEITAAEIINAAILYIEYLEINGNEFIGKELYPKFELKCDYESLDGTKKCNKIDLSNALYTGERMYEYYSDRNNDDLFKNVNILSDCNIEGFTNYTEHFKDNLAPYLNEQDGRGNDLHGLTGISTIRKQLKELIEKKKIEKEAEILKVSRNFNELIRQLEQKIDYGKYFNKYIVEYRNNANIASILNEIDTNGADVSMLTETQKNYIYNHITYEKIPDKLDRTASVINDVNFDYRSKAPRSFYVLESSVTGEKN